MIFTHTLSRRLALLRDRTVLVRAAGLAVAAALACELPTKTTGPTTPGGGGGPAPVASVAVSPSSAGLRVGAFMQLSATTKDALGYTLSGRTVTWASGNPAVATVSGTGLVTGMAPGSASVTATSEGKQGAAAISVTLVPVASVTVSPALASVAVGQTTPLTATPKDAAGNPLTGRVVTWVSNQTGTATVNGSGLVTGVAVGSATVTATSEGQSGTAVITVTATTVPVASVTVAPSTASVQAGQTVQLTATPKDANGNALSGRVVTWSSNNTATATVNNSGLVSGVAAGSATITATSEGQSGTAAITVTAAPPPPVPVASVTVSPASASVLAGQTVQLMATPKDAAGNPLTGRVVTWTSNQTGTATVNGSGLVTGVAAGSATITATSEGQSGTAAITVTAVPVASVTVVPATASVAVGSTYPLTAVARDAAGNILTGRTMTWSTSSALIATVASTGLVTGVAVGSATITATTGGQSGSATITVTTPPPPSACGNTGSGVCYYVDGTAGNDANPGTSAQPFRTLQKAADVVNPGDGVLVRDGLYTGGDLIVNISRSGTASNWINFQAEHKWGAVIDGQNNLSSTGVEIGGSYIRVAGFEVRNTNHYGIEADGGNNVTVAQNHVHDVGHYCTGTSNGIVGINAYAGNMTIEQNVVHDVGRFGPGEQGCNPGNDYWQNHDHGIYQGVGDNLVVRNNVFYNFTHGWAIQRYGSSVNGVQILNNTFAFPNPNKDGQIIIASGTTNLVIANNIFYQPTTAGVWFDGGGDGAVVSNNLTFGAPVSVGGSGLVLSGNLNNTDPLFVNTQGLDFHLRAGSPAINAGVNLANVLNDFEGVSRPQGAGWDIGAYEFH